MTYLKDEIFTIRGNEPRSVLMSFHGKGEKVGELNVADGIMKFTGNADEAAKVLMENVVEKYDQTVIELRKRVADLEAAALATTLKEPTHG